MNDIKNKIMKGNDDDNDDDDENDSDFEDEKDEKPKKNIDPEKLKEAPSPQECQNQ